MKHQIKQFETSRNTHVGEEVLLPFKGIVRGRILCGGLRDKNTYEYKIDRTFNRETWFSPLKRIKKGAVSCAKCAQRHNRIVDEYNEHRKELKKSSSANSTASFTLKPDECVINRKAVCIRTDSAHVSPVPDKDMWWVCNTPA